MRKRNVCTERIIQTEPLGDLIIYELFSGRATQRIVFFKRRDRINSSYAERCYHSDTWAARALNINENRVTSVDGRGGGGGGQKGKRAKGWLVILSRNPPFFTYGA